MDVEINESDEPATPTGTKGANGSWDHEHIARLLAFSASVDRTGRRLAHALESDLGDTPVWVALGALEFTIDRLLTQARRAVAEALTSDDPTDAEPAAETDDVADSDSPDQGPPAAVPLRLVPRPAG
ncbi:hypothetical protein OG689_40230 [Kitasatospora sp. NBC_00240]|uniref:hypothetical protein n=1 Tax=Kitasatospora sp. NBC_00240 TaxID=2903567 RepID=UPI00224E9B65|nr:hypothetical protein [Kitasatospora sp. NBC_00240]MCX5215406.1 hypothetical protein [Kitasatospora sp. NBC_00240]